MTRPHRLAAGVTAVVAAAALAACSSSSSSSSSASGASSASAGGSASGKSVVYIPGLTGIPFYTSVGCGASAQASTAGVNFSVQGAATFSVPLQTQVLNAVIASHPAAIMISITDPVAMFAPLERAKAAGIKVIMIDGDLSDKSVAVTDIQSNDITGGQLAADALGNLVAGKTGQVLIIDNATGSIISGDRASGFVNELKAKYPNITVLNTQYSNNSTATAASIARTAASTNPHLVGIYTLETDNTEGAITGIREAGKTGKVYLVGYDTSDPIVAGLQAGAVNADIVQYPYGEGMVGIQSAVDAIEGKPVPRDQTVGFVVATPSNVNTANVQKYIYKTHC